MQNFLQKLPLYLFCYDIRVCLSIFENIFIPLETEMKTLYNGDAQCITSPYLCLDTTW